MLAEVIRGITFRVSRFADNCGCFRPCYPSVADEVLLVGRKLGHPLTIRQYEQRVVTEAAVASRLVDYMPPDCTIEDIFLSGRADQGDHALESRRALLVRHSFQSS